jgi:hypothetical protein
MGKRKDEVFIRFSLSREEKQWIKEVMAKLWAEDYRSLFVRKFRLLLEEAEKNPKLIERLKKV